MGTPTTRAWIVVPALLSLAYAIAVVIAAWRAPEKGFQAFTGHRVVYVAPGGRAQAAGLREGDVIRAIDGVPVASTFDYAYRVLVREPGERVVLGVDRKGSGPLETRAVEIAIELAPAPPPWSALVATVLAAVLLVLGLVARIGRGAEPVARRFYRTTVMYAMVYVGALSWSRLLVHPVLAVLFLVALFAAPKLALDLSLELPHRIAAPWLRRITLGIALVLGGACGIAVAVAIYDFRTGGGDRALPWIEGTIAGQCAVIPIYTGVALWHQLRAHREAHGTARAQLRWLLFGQALCGLPALAAIPVAALDLDRFLIAGYQPFAGAVGTLWFVSYGLAVMRIRLADVDALIRSSLGYAVATGAAALVYVGVVLAAGWLTELVVGDAGPWAHLAAGIVAALAFGPLRARVTRWLDRRFFRDRRHYVVALRRASESLARLREPAVLAREVVAQVVEAVRAERGALYLHGAGGWTIAHAVEAGGTFPAEPSAPPDGIAVPIVGDNTRDLAAMLVLGPRRSGDLYSSEDRDLLGALAGQLATVLANARAYGTIVAKTEEIRELRDRLADENQFLRERIAAATGGATLAGDSAAVRELGKTVELVAKSDASILVLGESGTGKGLLARLVHATSARAAQPFLHVDCGAIAAGVFESELFGHERGAFTGATKLRRGPIELAHGGTLFLDEIGELPIELQPKLLRVLEERVVLRVGATQPVAVDVRIIAATNRDLEALTKAGAFREDLYFRLRVVELVVPPLRARRADLPALCAQLLPRAAKRCGRPVRPLAPAALDAMASYRWPGNVRELANVLERALVLGEGEITAAELELPVIAIAEAPIETAEAVPHDLVMEDIERRRLTAALRDAAGNQSTAAKALGMPRTTFINKLRRHGLL